MLLEGGDLRRLFRRQRQLPDGPASLSGVRVVSVSGAAAEAAAVGRRPAVHAAVVGQAAAARGRHRPGTDVMIFKIFSPKKIAKHGVFDSKHCLIMYAKKWSLTLIFEKSSNFFSQKIVKNR
jgi:hypothetical protein